MKRELNDALNDIALALDSSNPGYLAKVVARRGLERLRTAIEASEFERMQREFLAADLAALAKGEPVKTALAAAVELRIAALVEEGTAKAAKARIDVTYATADAAHVCGLSGYNPMIDERCPGCEVRIG